MDANMSIIVGFLAVGIIIGGLVGWLWSRNTYIVYKATVVAGLQAGKDALADKKVEMEAIKGELGNLRQDLQASDQQLARAQAENKTLGEQLKTQEQAMEKLNQKFTIEFENVAN